MESSVLTSLSLVFLAAGFTLLTTSLMLSRRARRYRRSMQSLLQIGAQGLDPINIPAAAWPVLRDAGWRSMTVTGHWFGAAVNIELGQQPAAIGPGSSGALEVQVRSGDVDLVLRLQHSAKGGENWMFAEQIARVFVLLFETGVGARTEALAVSMAERARLSLYLQHDMRNLAQWVGWVCTDFAACQDEESLLTAARRLKENTPLAQERVHRVRTALSQKSGSDNPRVVELQFVVRKAAHLAGIDVELSGTAQAWIARGLLARVLDNLFSNLSPNWREIDAVKPVEGATSWSDTWMLSAQAANPNCMKLWMDWIASPWANAQVAVWFGEAPSNALACDLDGMAEHCDTFHAADVINGL